MELAGERQVGVDLQGKRFVEGEDLACQLLRMEVGVYYPPWADKESPDPSDPSRPFPPAAGSS